jgi:hypothetical protein
MARELEKLGKTFRRSWMSFPECVVFVDEERVRRQNAMVLAQPDASPETDGWRRDQGPIAFDGLVGTLKLGFTERGDARREATLAITIACAMIGELLAAAFNEERRAGGVFDLSLDQQRQDRQVALQALRNAVCHPGCLPTPVNRSSNVDELIGLLDDEKNAFKKELERDRRHINGAAVARWAVSAADELGRFEIGRALVTGLERRGAVVTAQQRGQIERRAVNRDSLVAMLKSAVAARSAEALIKAR